MKKQVISVRAFNTLTFFSMLALSLTPNISSAEDKATTPSADATVADDDAQLFEDVAPGSSDPSAGEWSTPRPVFDLHGYFRFRGEWQKKFFLNRADRLPFERFVPADRLADVAGGCGGTVEPNRACDTGNGVLGSANMRLRLDPTISISDDVRIHMRVDVLDNLVLGSTPESKNATDLADGEADPRAPGVPIDTTTKSVEPPETGVNSASDAIRVRRVWAEVTNRGLGQLRFGRMGNHWGLGMLWNGGDGIDGDFSTEVDRVMGITRFKGIYFGASWDFPSQGQIFDRFGNAQGIPFDLSQKDDIRQWSFLLARRLAADEQRERMDKGKVVLNAGLYFTLRKQKFSSSETSLTATQDDVTFIRRDAKMFMPDIWVQLLYKGLRLELEIAYIGGRIRNVEPDAFLEPDGGGRFKFRQLGIAFEGEYRLLAEKLAIFLNTGFASGDPDVDGLSIYENTVAQESRKSKIISHFGFHPNYRVDLILFRNILGTIGGAWYFNPAISYDILRNAFGQVLGGRFDLIYSRAAKSGQTYSGKVNLGVEIDLSLYYRSEDGPGFLDGYFVQFQYGILFPLAGLKVAPGEDHINLANAQTMRLILGVQF